MQKYLHMLAALRPKKANFNSTNIIHKPAMIIELPVAVLADKVFVHLGIADAVTCLLVSCN